MVLALVDVSQSLLYLFGVNRLVKHDRVDGNFACTLAQPFPVAQSKKAMDRAIDVVGTTGSVSVSCKSSRENAIIHALFM